MKSLQELKKIKEKVSAEIQIREKNRPRNAEKNNKK